MRADALDMNGDYATLTPLLAAMLRRAAAIPESRGGDTIDWLLHLEETYAYRGDARYYSGDKIGALADYERGAALLDRGMQSRPDARIVYRQAYAAFNISATLPGLHRDKEAVAWIERGVAAAARLRSFEDSPRARHMQNIVTLQYATELRAVGRLPEAVIAAEQSIAGRKTMQEAADDWAALRQRKTLTSLTAPPKPRWSPRNWRNGTAARPRNTRADRTAGTQAP